MREFLVADLFCGAGGTSTGAEKAVKALGSKMRLTCVNHWPLAIETHRRNHPTARHYIEDISVAKPVNLVPEGYLDLLIASPECTHFSRARGGKPVNDQSRMNPWAIVRWLTDLDVRCLLVENVPEFVEWGPITEACQPHKKKKGQYFEAWVKTLWELGYKTEWKFLNAADYGDATTRTRFFLQARKDGVQIQWPEPSHVPAGSGEMWGIKPRWRAAREIIDWQSAGRSLIDDPKYLKKPLSEKTRRRIARGLQRYGGQYAPLYIRLLGLEEECDGGSAIPEPFIIAQRSHSAARDMSQPIPTVAVRGAISLIDPQIIKYYGTNDASPIDSPVPTVTTKQRFGLMEPVVAPFVLSRNGNDLQRSVEEPIPTATTRGAGYLVQPFILQNRIRPDGDRVYSIDRPLNTITGHGAGALVEPVMVQTDQTGGNGKCVRSVDEPLPTLVTKKNLAIVEPQLVNIKGTSNTSRIEDPVPTICTKQHFGLVDPVLVQVNHGDDQGASRMQAVDEPLPTVTTKRNVGLIEPVMERADRSVDPRRMVTIDGQPFILDIRFRMLNNRELARATGFDDEETTYEFVGNVAEVTKQIGNAVPVNLAAALVTSILGAGVTTECRELEAVAA